MCKHKLKNYINVNNHKTVVIHMDEEYDLVAYKNNPRAEYMRTPDPRNAVAYKMTTIGISNMPLPVKDIKYVVSREVIRATRVLEQRILRTPGLKEWLIQQGIKDFAKKVRFISIKTLADKWPEFDIWLDEHKGTEKTVFFKDIKRYVGRLDLFAPGPKVRNIDNSIQACDGLISGLDEDIYEETA